jgi:hypothetical protein
MSRAAAVLASMLALSAACLSVQEFGGAAPGPRDAGEPDASEPPIADDAKPPSGTYKWQWVNPAPTGRALYGAGGTSSSDVWVTGEGATAAHWNGKAWDVRRSGADRARWFDVGVRAKNDVWFASDDAGKIGVVHWDGATFIESYPFAGSDFLGFSHGPGARLFASFASWEILELSPAGAWQKTDVSADDVFGPPIDVWTTASGEAWAITSGAKILHLPAGATKWELLTIPGVPSPATGLGLAGAGARLCAFYTGTGAGSGVGYVTYDGAWHVAPQATIPIAADRSPHGSRVACYANGQGVLVYGDDVYLASDSSAPELRAPGDFPGEKLRGAWSPDGTTAYAVGALGALLSRTAAATSWSDVGPTIRKDLLGIDVGLDGAVIAVDALQPTRSSGGEVLFYRDGALSRWSGGGFSPPRLPVAVAVVDANDAWVLSNDASRVGIGRYRNGAWGVTRFLDDGVTGVTPLAIFAPAKDDVWVTAQEACPDLDPLPNGACSKKTLAAYAWHYDGSGWSDVAVPAIYRSIHGARPDDLWFAGDGVAHWDGKTLTRVTELAGAYTGVWSSAPGRVWLWGERAVLFDGKTTVPVEKALGSATEWTTAGIAESAGGDVFVLTKRATGTTLLWFDPSRTKLVEQITSDLELRAIRGRGDQLWAIGAGGAALRFAPPTVN